MKGMPWMKLFTEDLDADCRILSLRARGAWLWILMDLRNNGGSRTLTLDQWARVLRDTREETAAALAELIEQEICDSNVRPNALQQIPNGQNNALITVTSRRLKRESKAALMNRMRQKRLYDKRQPNAEPNGQPNAYLTGVELEAEADTEKEAGVYVVSSSGRRGQITARKSDPKANTHTQAPPPDFLTKELRKWTEAAAPEIDPEAELEKFQDYYRSNGKSSADWPAAWRQWIRIAVERQHRARAPARESAGEHNDRIFREIEAEEQARGRS